MSLHAFVHMFFYIIILVNITHFLHIFLPLFKAVWFPSGFSTKAHEDEVCIVETVQPVDV